MEPSVLPRTGRGFQLLGYQLGTGSAILSGGHQRAVPPRSLPQAAHRCHPKTSLEMTQAALEKIQHASPSDGAQASVRRRPASSTVGIPPASRVYAGRQMDAVVAPERPSTPGPGGGVPVLRPILKVAFSNF